MVAYIQCSAMSVVSVRLPDDVEAYLKRRGLSPGTLARALVEREVAQMRLRDSLGFLESVSRRPSKPIADLLREERDAH